MAASEGSATASGVPTVPLDALARHVGETVTIIEEVKGVSTSPRSGTRYLNFGDAYPRQKLSVKIAKEQEELRRIANRALGLKVRVTGLLESGKDGPAISITASDQLEIIKDDSINLTALTAGKPAFPRRTPPGPYDNMPHEGEAFGQLLRWKLEALADQGKYEELEEIAAAWRKPEARMLDGRWNLFVFYSALSPGSGASEEEFDEARRRLEDWRKLRPGAIEPVILLASLETSHAWHARGGGWASTVTEEGWRLMRERLAAARTLLESVADRRRECPQWAAEMQIVALGQGWPDKKVQGLLAEATEAWPEFWSYYFNEARRLLPRWHGSPGDWEKYSRSFSGDLGKELSVRIPWASQWAYANIFREADIPWSQMKEGFEFLLKRYPESARTKSAFAVYAGMAEDRGTCRRLLDELGDKVSMEFWVSWQNVDVAREWIADTNRPPPAIFGLSEPKPE